MERSYIKQRERPARRRDRESVGDNEKQWKKHIEIKTKETEEGTERKTKRTWERNWERNCHERVADFFVCLMQCVCYTWPSTRGSLLPGSYVSGNKAIPLRWGNKRICIKHRKNSVPKNETLEMHQHFSSCGCLRFPSPRYFFFFILMPCLLCNLHRSMQKFGIDPPPQCQILA